MAIEDLIHWQIYDRVGRRKYISEEELQRFLSLANGREPSIRALSHVLAYTGCRLSEALKLTRENCDMETMTMTFPTLKRRGVVFRSIPISEELAGQLWRLPTRSDGRFWLMTRTTAWRSLKEIMSLAGIAGPMATSKGFRHSFGIRAATHNVPLTLISKWMGHTSLKTTAIYLQVVGAEERKFASRLW